MERKLNEDGFRYFKLADFNCKHTGKNLITKDLIYLLDDLSERCGFPLVVTSGYRDKTHPVEVKKDKPGYHTQGIAVDLLVESDAKAYIILKEAFALGFKGIARGKYFIHLDTRPGLGKSWDY